jgi:hypothetical protein
MRRKLLLRVSGILTLFAGQGGALQAPSLDVLYDRLISLERQVLGHGSSRKEVLKLREIKNAFRRQGAPACAFVISKVDDMNKKITDLVMHGNDWLSKSVVDAESNDGLVKYQLFGILADLFPLVPAEPRHEILRSLFESYTPVSASLGGGTMLDLAFMRIGKGAMETEFTLANNSNEAIRCRAFDILNSLVEEARGSAAFHRPCKLSCKSSEAIRKRELQAWQTWWSNYHESFVFPTLPDSP